MNYLAVIGMLIFFISFFSSLYLWFNKKIGLINIIISIFLAIFAFWGISLYFATTSSVYYQSYAWHMLLGNISFICSAILINLVLFLSETKLKFRHIYIAYFPTMTLVILSRIYPELYIINLNFINISGCKLFFPIGGILYNLSIIVYIFHIFYATLFLKYHIENSIPSKETKKVLTGLNLGFLLVFFPIVLFHFSIMNYFFLPLSLFITPFAILFSLFFFLKYNMKNLDIYWGYRVTHFLYLLIYLTLTLTFLYLIYHNKTLLFIVTIFFILFFPFFHTWVKEHTKENLYKTNYAYLKELSLLSVEIMNSNLFSKKEIARQSFGKLGNILNINMIALFLEDDLGFGYKQIIINNFNFMKKNIDFINNQAPLISLIKLKKIYFTKQELLTYAEIDSFNIMADLDASFVFPIFIGEVLYGVLFLGNKIKNKENFTDEDLKMVKNVIKSTEKTLLRCKKTQQQYSGHNKLTQTSNIEFIASLKRLIKTNNINELTNNIISLLLRNFHSEYASFYVYSIEKKGYYNAITNANFIPKQSDFIKILHAKEEILNFRHVSFMTDKYSEDSYAILKNTMVMLKANLIVPIVMNSLLGFIVLGKETSDYSSNDMFKINFIAHTLSMTLQDIVYACNINQATEVYNKIYFNNSLEEGMIRSFKTKKALSLMFLKTDTSLGKELKPLIRISDILCKYSEERFVVILPETKNTIVKKVAKRIEDNFSSLGISVVAGFDTLDPKQYHSFNIGMLYSIKEKLINTAILRTKR